MKLGIILAAGALVVGASAFAQLNRSQTGKSSFDTFTEMTGGTNTWSGIWGGSPAWVQQSAVGPQDITISADVELWGMTSLDNSRIYFHKANDQAPPPAYLNGTLYSNRGMFVGVVGRKADGNPATLDELTQSTNYAGGAIPTAEGPAKKVPLDWKGQWTADGGANWSAYKDADNVGDGANGTVHNAYWWLMGNESTREGGYFNFRLKVTPNFPALATAGRYELDPVLVIAPEL